MCERCCLNRSSTRLADPETQEFKVAPFDGKALDMFKLVAMQSKKVMYVGISTDSNMSPKSSWSFGVLAHALLPHGHVYTPIGSPAQIGDTILLCFKAHSMYATECMACFDVRCRVTWARSARRRGAWSAWASWTRLTGWADLRTSKHSRLFDTLSRYLRIPVLYVHEDYCISIHTPKSCFEGCAMHLYFSR